MLPKRAKLFLQRWRKKADQFVPKKISTTAGWFAQNRDIARYIEVVPETTGCFPKEVQLTHPIFEVEEWQKPSFTIPASFVIELPNARLIRKFGTLTTPDGVILGDISRTDQWFKPEHPIMEETELPPARWLRGTYLAIPSYYVCTYHWLIDLLPRIRLVEMAGYRLSDFDGFLIRKPKYPAHVDALPMAGIPLEKVKWTTHNFHFQCDRVVAPSFTNNTRESHAFIFPYLRHQFVPRDFRRPNPARRIYISRKDAPFTRRGIVNEQELFPILEAEGFEIVTMSDLTFEEQVRLFASADTFVCPHGGALGNLVFCEAPTRVMEIFTPSYNPTFMRSLCRQLGFVYYAIVGEEIPNPRYRQESIRLDPGFFRAELKKFLAM